MGIHIQVHNPNRSYFAGQVVHGIVVVSNAKSDKIKQVTILLQGKGRVHFTEQEPYTVYTTHNTGPNGQSQTRAETRYRTVHYTASEKYVSLLSILTGDGENSAIPEGTTTYPFCFQLPSNLPSSFNSQIGQISYILKGKVKKPSFFKSNDKAKLPFTVNGILDLNLQPGITAPLECLQSKGSNLCACRKGKLNFVLRLPTRSGFVPGEAINFTAGITNGSNRKITGTKASLQQVTKFYAQGRSKIKKSQVREIKGPEVDKGDHELWEGNLVIPAIPPSKLAGNCRIIDLEYFLYFEMKISGLSSSLTGKLPVTIGTIPLRVTFGNFETGPHNVQGIGMRQAISSQIHREMGFNIPNSGMEPLPSTSKGVFPPQIVEESIPSAPVFSDYPDLPPPSYAEAVGSEGFTWNPEGKNTHPNEHGSDNLGLKKDDDEDIPNSSAASAPTIDEFVPNYITYNMRN